MVSFHNFSPTGPRFVLCTGDATGVGESVVTSTWNDRKPQEESCTKGRGGNLFEVHEEGVPLTGEWEKHGFRLGTASHTLRLRRDPSRGTVGLGRKTYVSTVSHPKLLVHSFLPFLLPTSPSLGVTVVTFWRGGVPRVESLRHTREVPRRGRPYRTRLVSTVRLHLGPVRPHPNKDPRRVLRPYDGRRGSRWEWGHTGVSVCAGGSSSTSSSTRSPSTR